MEIGDLFLLVGSDAHFSGFLTLRSESSELIIGEYCNSEFDSDMKFTRFFIS